MTTAAKESTEVTVTVNGVDAPALAAVVSKAVSKGRTDVSLLDSKQYTKYAKFAGEKNAKEVLGKNKEELERIIVDSEVALVQLTQDKNANQAFQKAKETVTDFNSGERDTANPIKAKRALAVAALRSLKDV